MTARQQFVQDPVAFMSSNILRCQFFDGGVNISKSRPYVVTVAEMRGSPIVVNKTGGKVYYLTVNTAGCGRDEKVPIYFIGYKDNDTVSAVLGLHARMTFTANMDGCTLGIGSMPGDGTCLVTHANKKSAGGGAAQSREQIEQLRDVYGQDEFHAISPSAYMDAMGGSHLFKGTNFGVQRDGWWFFYTHRWMKPSGSIAGHYIHGGCEESSFLG